MTLDLQRRYLTINVCFEFEDDDTNVLGLQLEREVI